ncbi:MAG: right-handed parallel beta-helix repeat-containing protein [Phycisphaerae bacterium]|nr:right-handed parallel beta-helix repeat-containing protein [Phycisphaerae bacterium]
MKMKGWAAVVGTFSLSCIGWLVLGTSVASADLTDGLVAYYPFQGNAKDASGQGHDGTVHGATLTSDQDGAANSAYEFDGVDDYIGFGTAFPNMAEMTMEIWFYEPSGQSGFRFIFVDADGPELAGVKFQLNGDSGVYLEAWKNGFPFKELYLGVGGRIADRWVNIAWAFTGTESSVYVDGVLQAWVPRGGSNVGRHNVFLGVQLLGSQPFGSYWKGKISSLRIYDRALSGAEVLALHNLKEGAAAGGAGGETVLYVDDDAAADPKAGDISVSDPEEDGTREHPFDSIQEAIGAAADGQKVVVLGGTYWESIDFLGKKITVTGFDPNTSAQRGVPCPVIDGNYQGTVVKFVGGEDANSVLSGFVITRGQGREAGGIFCSGSSPTITDCLIVGNRSQNLFGGGGIYCSKSNAVFDHCTISGNYGGQAGAGFYCSESQNFIANSILWGNTPADIGFPMFGELTPPEFSYSDLSIEAFGPGNIARDPLFVAPGHWGKSTDASVLWDPAKPDAVWVDGNYRLCMGSPCIDAGDPNYPSDPNLLDLDGQPRIINDRVDMGVYEYGSTASVTFAATYKEMSITLVNDPNAPNPDRTYVGHTTIQLNASFKLKLLAQATAVSAAGGTWTVTLNPEIIGPGKNISVELSIRGEDVDVSQISATKGTVVLADVEVGGILAP